MNRRDDEIKEIHEKFHWSYPLIVGGGFLTICAVIGAWLFGADKPIIQGNMLAYVTNLWTDGIGIGIGVLIIDQFNRRRERLDAEEKEGEQKAEAEKAEKQRLIVELRSKDNITALNALEHIQEKGWDKDGTLERATLWGSSLQNAGLIGSHLKDAIFNEANLQFAF
jgi:hypothetical protein